jgi:Flp pilus assembly protein TadD
MRLSSNIPKALVLGVTLTVALWGRPSREQPSQAAQVTIQTGRAGCKVDLDSAAMGATDAKGNLVVANVEPGDHYVHVACPQEAESAYFISPQAKQKILIQPTTEHVQEVAVSTDPTHVAENKMELRRLVQQAVQLRSQARLDEAVSELRQAQQLDPENSDLHRELGITFLLSKEWKRARVEMIEAIRHDSTDADAHNGLGYALEKLGDLDGAVKEYRTATQLDPDDETYRTHYLDALVKIAARMEKEKEKKK